jgi:hypothetical protein
MKREILASAGIRTTDRPEVRGRLLWVKGCLFFFAVSLTHTNCAWQTAHGLLSRSIQDSKNLYLLLTMPGKGTFSVTLLKIAET